MQNRSDAVRNRERIIDAAAHCFASQGLNAEIKDIVHAASVGVGTIYRNFACKEELLAAVVREEMAQLSALLDEAAEQPDPLDGLRFALLHTLASSDRLGWLLEAIVAGHISPEVIGEIAAFDYVTRIEAMLQAAVDRQALRADLDPGVAAASLMGVLAPQYAEHHRGRDAGEVVDLLMDQFLYGAEPGADGRRRLERDRSQCPPRTSSKARKKTRSQ